MRSQGIYRKIYTKMWGDEKFMKLSSPQPNAQTLWLYLLTGPHNTVLPGIFILGEMSLAEFLNWDIEPTKIILTELANEGMLEVDSKTKVVILPTAVQYNPPESPNTPTAWARQFASIPECSLKCKFLKYLVKYMSTKADLKNIFLAEFQDWLTEEQKAIPIFPDPPFNFQEEWHAPEITSIDASRHLRETDRPLNELEKLVEELKIHCKNHEKKPCEMWVRAGEETYRLTGGVSTFGSNVVFFATTTGENHF